MILSRNNQTLPRGIALIIEDVEYPYAALETSEELRDDLGVTVVEPEASSLEQRRTSIMQAVDARRDDRIDAGFVHQGVPYQSRPSDRENIMGAAQAAGVAISTGAQPGDLRWANPDADFQWIAADNTLVPMDAFAVLALFQRGVAFKSAQTFYARALKDAALASEEPEAIDIETGWPA